MTQLRTLPKPLTRRPDQIDNLEYLREFGETFEDLRRRTALLEGVSAYGNVAMTRNEWVVGGRPLLRFGEWIGDPKNVSLLPDGAGLLLGMEGLWRLDCYTWAASTIYTGHAFAQIEVEIKLPASMGGGIKFTKPFKVDTDDGSVGGAYSFIAEEPGYEIRVYAQTGRWRRMLGGTRYSYLSVNRWNPEKVNTGSETVPDGPDPRP
ncbi:hypothetical protein [Prescottella equi]